MRFVCDAAGQKTWFRIETEAEAAQESELMRHAVEKHFRRAHEQASQAYRPVPFVEQDIGRAAHVRRTMPVFLTLRDGEGNVLATAMLRRRGGTTWPAVRWWWAQGTATRTQSTVLPSRTSAGTSASPSTGPVATPAAGSERSQGRQSDRRPRGASAGTTRTLRASGRVPGPPEPLGSHGRWALPSVTRAGPGRAEHSGASRSRLAAGASGHYPAAAAFTSTPEDRRHPGGRPRCRRR